LEEVCIWLSVRGRELMEWASSTHRPQPTAFAGIMVAGRLGLHGSCGLLGTSSSGMGRVIGHGSARIVITCERRHSAQHNGRGQSTWWGWACQLQGVGRQVRAFDMIVGTLLRNSMLYMWTPRLSA
jgi:hypothetical protein